MRVVLPWSTCPIVPMLQWGLSLLNTCFSSNWGEVESCCLLQVNVRSWEAETGALRDPEQRSFSLNANKLIVGPHTDLQSNKKTYKMFYFFFLGCTFHLSNDKKAKSLVLQLLKPYCLRFVWFGCVLPESLH